MREHHAALPSGWGWATAGDLIRGIEAGKSFKCDERSPVNGETGVAKVSAVTWGRYNEEESKTCTRLDMISPALFVQKGDFLFSRANTIDLVGACVIAEHVTRPVMLSDKILRFDVHLGHAPWLLWWLRSAGGRGEIQRLATGNQDSMRNIGQARIKSIDLPIAPLPEQHRIVEAIESYFTRLDDAVATLERVQRNLKRYRASVLQAAVEGRLVPTEAELARAEGRDYEPASVLLERILTERRRRWEQAGRRGKYQEPAAPDTSRLPDLPEGWCWATMGHFIGLIEAGKNFKCAERPPQDNEVGVVKVSAVTWGTFNEQESKTCTRDELVNAAHFVEPGDFLFSRANTIDLVGACVIVAGLTKRLMLSDKILRLRLVGGLDEWLLWTLRSRHGRNEIERLATGNQESMRNIGQENLRGIRVPVPPMRETHRVVESVRRLLSVAEDSGYQADRTLTRCARLRQSILKWAFEGKLADQDPNDEPASVLLERIKAEREAAGRTRASSGRRGGRRAARTAAT